MSVSSIGLKYVGSRRSRSVSAMCTEPRIANGIVPAMKKPSAAAMSHASLLCVVRTVLASGTALGDLGAVHRILPDLRARRMDRDRLLFAKRRGLHGRAPRWARLRRSGNLGVV